MNHLVDNTTIICSASIHYQKQYRRIGREQPCARGSPLGNTTESGLAFVCSSIVFWQCFANECPTSFQLPFFFPKTRSVVILAFQGCLFLLRRLPHIMYQFSQGPRGCVVSGPLGNPTVGDETKSFDSGKNPSSFKEIIMYMKYAVLQWVVYSVNLSFVILFERTITSFWEISCFSTGSFYTDHSQHYHGSYLQEAAG